MSNRTITILLVLVIGSIAVLFMINLTNIYGNKTPEKYISLNSIYGMAIEHKGKPYTLNFEQQNSVANVINRSVLIDSKDYINKKPLHFPYEFVTIFRFGKEPVKIKPIANINQQLIFQAPEFNPQGLFRETGPAKLQSLLTETYDTP